MTDTSALRAFIEARLTDDQSAIDKAARFRYDHPSDAPWERSRLAVAHGAALSSDPFIALHNPDREAREVAAKRAILAVVDAIRHYAVDEDGYGSCAAIVVYEELSGPCDCNREARQLQILRPLASVWSDHPDYDPSWSTA